MLAIALVTELFTKISGNKLDESCTGPGCDLLRALNNYSKDTTKDEDFLLTLLEYGAVVTHCIDGTDQDGETFVFTERIATQDVIHYLL